MPEPTVLDLTYLREAFLRANIVLQRPVVQIQLLSLAIAIALGWLLSRTIWSYVTTWFPKRVGDCPGNGQHTRKRPTLVILQVLSTPILILLTVRLTTALFAYFNWFSGYLEDGLVLLFNFLIFRLVIGFLYVVFPYEFVERHRVRFFGPSFLLLATGSVLSWFFDLSALSKVTLVIVFEESISIGAAFVTVVGLYFWVSGVAFIEDLFLELFKRKISRDRGAPYAVSLLLRYFLIGIGIVFIFGYVGVSSTAMAAITGGLSVGVGFGLKEVIGNFVSGIWLLFEGALKPGDIIAVDGKMSKVVKLGIRATTVQVIQDNSEEIIPNQIFFTENVTTLTGTNNLIFLSLVVGASYDCQPATVVEVLLQVAHNRPEILDDPPPLALAMGFGESSIDFELKFWIDDPLLQKPVKSALIVDIWKAFADRDIEIPYPQRDLHLRTGTLIPVGMPAPNTDRQHPENSATPLPEN